MHVNPYAAPISAQPGDGHVQGEPQPWDVGDVLGSAWRIFKPSWFPIVAGFFLITVLSAIPGYTPGILVQAGVLEETSRTYLILNLACVLTGIIVGQFFGAGFARALVRLARTGNVRFADVFSGGAVFLGYFALWILRTLAILIGLVVFLVPGIILAFGTSLAPYYVVDQRMGPIDAIRASWAATDGHKVNLFVYELASVAVALLGLAACCLGYFPAMTILGLGWAIIYLRLSGLAHGTPSDIGAAWGISGPPGGGQGGGPGPGAGYGPHGPPGGGYGPYGPPGGAGSAPPGGGYGPPGGGGYYGPPGGGGYGPPGA